MVVCAKGLAIGLRCPARLCLVVLLAACNLATAQEADPSNLVEQWLSLEVQRGRLQSAWDDRKNILDQQIQLLEEEKKSLEAVVEAHKSQASDATEERSQVLRQQNALEEQQDQLEKAVNIAFHKTVSRVSRLPPPLQDQWQVKAQRFVDEDLPISEELEGLLGFLGDLYDFDQRVTVHSGNVVLQKAGGAEPSTVLVDQVYLGLARGWYASADGSYFGYGESTPAGWTWYHGDEASQRTDGSLNAQRVRELISVARNPDAAKLVQMPLLIETFAAQSEL